ncbi:MAG: DNA-3-methyladenine glycosylase 2 family protein [Bacteroidia bacterium]|nr:DNA-3-methyladenine glycosylase 2 family protein [Bacteroidia bacterium]
MNTYNEQIKHLKKDKILKKVIDKVGPLETRSSSDLYLSLLKAIVSQQLSVKAADTIWNRFLKLFKDNYPEPEKLLKLKDEKLRAAGLSFQKAGYLKNIARFSIEQTLDYKKLKSKSDDELIEYLVSIKGVGRWTVEMLLMFSLERSDVFPKDDLGIQNGIKALYGITTVKRELYSDMETIAQKWKPFRTLACRYIWRYKDMNVMA